MREIFENYNAVSTRASNSIAYVAATTNYGLRVEKKKEGTEYGVMSVALGICVSMRKM